MSSVVYIDPAGRREMDTREMDSGRDYLSLEQRAGSARRVANVVNFTSRLESQCAKCGRMGHRASKCSQP